MQISLLRFYMQTKKKTKKKPNLEIFSTNMVDIDKILNIKPKIKPKTIIPEQYWGYLNVFDENETNQLPPIRKEKKNHEIELLEKKTNGPLGAVI